MRNPNERKANESFKQYRARLREEQKAAKIARRGHLLWHSASQGTYERAKHGDLK